MSFSISGVIVTKVSIAIAVKRPDYTRLISRELGEVGGGIAVGKGGFGDESLKATVEGDAGFDLTGGGRGPASLTWR